MSNESRGLARHVDPNNPTGPLLNKKPNMSGRNKPAAKKATNRPKKDPEDPKDGTGSKKA